MPTPYISNFILPNSLEISNTTVAGMVCPGYTGYIGYVPPVFTGGKGAVNDPGGLFGWLIHARSGRYPTATGITTASYLVYNTSATIARDMNSGLTGATFCLVSTPTEGGTYGFFLNTSGTITGRTFANDLLLALNYLSYGGTLVLSGTTKGLSDYTTTNNRNIDVLIGNSANQQITDWLKQNPYTVGIFPTKADSTGQFGAGYTMQDFTNFAGLTAVATGTTFSTRIFNVYGVKQIGEFDTSQLVPESVCSGYYQSAIADVAGFYEVAANSNLLLNSLAGPDISVPLNGTIINPVDWSNSNLKSILKNNRVNYFINATNKFLGQDFMGATASTADVTVSERFGVSAIQLQVNKNVSDISLKYLFKVNNNLLRAQVINDVQAYLNTLSTFIDLTGSYVTCDESNGNVDNTNVLYITVTVKPIISTSSFVLNYVVGQ